MLKPRDVLTLHNRNMHRNGIVDVNARKNIGTGIRPVKPGYPVRKDIFMRHKRRAEIRPVRIDGADHKAEYHPAVEKGRDMIKIRTVHEKEIQYPPEDIDKPQKVRYDEIFAKGNHIIEASMHDMKACRFRDGFLQDPKPKKIEDPVVQHPGAAVFFDKLSDSLHPAPFPRYPSLKWLKYSILFTFCEAGGHPPIPHSS